MNELPDLHDSVHQEPTKPCGGYTHDAEPADNISRRNKVGVIISATVLGIIAIAVIAMYVLSL